MVTFQEIADDPKYLPKIICQRPKGLVNKSSSVPNRLSSEKLLIIIAGMRGIKSQGVSIKKLFKSAKPELIMLKFVSKNHRNNVLIVKKIPMLR